MDSNQRSQLIRIAASMPNQCNERKQLLKLITGSFPSIKEQNETSKEFWELWGDIRDLEKSFAKKVLKEIESGGTLGGIWPHIDDLKSSSNYAPKFRKKLYAYMLLVNEKGPDSKGGRDFLTPDALKLIKAAMALSSFMNTKAFDLEPYQIQEIRKLHKKFMVLKPLLMLNIP